MASKAVLDLIVSLKDEASSKLADIGNSIASVGTMAAGAGLAVGGALVAGLGAAGAAGLQFNSSMEQVEAQLNAFLKDGALVDSTLEMIRRRAAATPFAFEDMARATTALIPAAKSANMQVEGLLETAEILAASNPAEGLEGAAFALKEALSGDFTSIIERFNLPRARLKELREQGVPDIEAVRIAMQELGLDTSLVTNLANTASGRWSTLMDTLQGVAATATGGLFKGMSATLGRINEMLADPVVQERLNAVAELVGQKLASAFEWLVSAVERGWNAIQLFQKAASGEWIESWLMGPLEQVVVMLGRMFAAFQSGGNPFVVFEDGASYISEILGALGVAEPTAQRVGQVVKEMADGIMWGLQMARDAVTTFQQALAGDWVDSGLVHPFHRVIGVIGQTVAAFQQGGLQGVIDTLLPYLQAGFANLVAWIQQQAGVLLAAFIVWKDAFIAWVAPAIAEFMLQWPYLLDSLLDWITKAAGPILAQLGEWAIAFGEWIIPMIPDILAALAFVSAALLVWLTETAVILAVQFVTVWLPAFLGWVAEAGKRLIPLLQEVEATIWGWITDAAQPLIDKAASIGKNIIQGIINGIKGMAGGLIGAATDAAAGVAGAFSDFFLMRSPSRLMEQYGQYIGQGLTQGLEQATAGAVDAANSLSRGMVGAMATPAAALAGAPVGAPVGASGGGRQVVFNFNFNAPLTVANENDRRQLVDFMMSEADKAVRGWDESVSAVTRGGS